MTQKLARYSVTIGLAGCYMPDSCHGPLAFSTRRELRDYIAGELEYLDWPASMIHDVGLRDLWRFIQRNGSSVAHFSLQRQGYEIAFHGLTEAEFDEQNDES